MQTPSKRETTTAIRSLAGLILFVSSLCYYALFPGYAFIFQILFAVSILVMGMETQKPVFGLFWPVLGGMFIASVFSINRIESLPVWATYAVILVLSSLVPRPNQERILRGFVIATGIIGFVSAASVLCMSVGAPLPQSISFLQSNEDLLIPHFGHALYAVFLLVAFPYAFGKAVEGRMSRKWTGITLYFILCAILTLSKGLWIAIALQCLFFLLRYRKMLLRPLFVVMATAVVVMTMAYLWLGTGNRLTGKLVKPSVASRIEYWRQGTRVISSSSPGRLLFGNGPGTFYEYSNRFQGEPDYWSRSAHNFFLQFIIENGLFTTVFLFIAGAILLLRNMRSYSFPTLLILSGVVGYSFFGTADMSMAPVLFVFLLLLQGAESGKAKRIDISVRNGVGFVLIAIWVMYGMIYLTYFVGGSADRRFIGYFPYDRTAWMMLIDRQAGPEVELDKIREQYRASAMSATDLDRMIIEKKNELHMYCGAFRDGAHFLKNVPFDRSVLSVVRDSSQTCHDMPAQERKILWIDLEPRYKNAYILHRTVRQLMQIAAVEAYRTGDMKAYERWSTKIWNFTKENSEKDWEGEMLDVPGTALPADKPFSIRISANNKGDPSGLVLNATPNPDGLVWRAGNTSLFIGIGEAGRRIYIDVHGGVGNRVYTLLSRSSLPHSSFYDIELRGRNTLIGIRDETGLQIAELDVNELTNNVFPYGLFPEGRYYLGYGVSPRATLVLRGIWALPLHN